MSGIWYAGNIWLISFDPPRDMKSNFPGWHIVREAKFADVANVLNIAPGSAYE
jgi:hypothetical protein